MTDTVVRTRRGWYHGWTIVAACVLSQAVANGLPVNAFSLFLQDWSTQLHAPISFFQLGLAALGIVSAFGSPGFVTLTTNKFASREKLIHLPSGENFGSSISCSLAETIGFVVIVFKSSSTRLFVPMKSIEPESGDHK